MQELISRADFARLTGKSKPGISKLCRGKLAPAMVGDRIDAAHPVARAYVTQHAPQKAAPAPKKTSVVNPKASKAPPPKRGGAKSSKSKPPRRRAPELELDAEDDHEDPELPFGTDEEIEEFQRILRPLTERFGTRRTFRDWLIALKDLEIIREKRLKNEQEEGTLIERARVETHVIAVMVSAFDRLLRDVPRKMVARLYEMGRANASQEQGERQFRDEITAVLTPARDKVVRALRAKKKRGG